MLMIFIEYYRPMNIRSTYRIASLMNQAAPLDLSEHSLRELIAQWNVLHHWLTVQANKTIKMQPHPLSLLSHITACCSTARKVSLFAAFYLSHLMLVSNLISHVGNLPWPMSSCKECSDGPRGAADSWDYRIAGYSVVIWASSEN